MLTQIHEYKGEQASILADKAEMLAPLAEMARVQSTEASNRMEGVSASDSRIRKLVLDKTTPRTRDERKIAGYRDVLAAVQENYAYLPPKTSVILQMYHDLGKYSGGALGGIYRSTDGGAGEEGTPGRRISPQPVPAEEIPQAMERLCASFDEALRNPVMDPLLLTPLFVLDFLCIQPFHGGNGPMSRLLTLLLLDRAGYLVGNYISLAGAPRDGARRGTGTSPLSAMFWRRSWRLTGSSPDRFSGCRPAAFPSPTAFGR